PELQRPFRVPGWDEVEHRVGRMLDPFELEMRVPVLDVDELRPALVCACRDGPGELLLPETGGDVEDLARLDVDAEVHDQVGESLELRRHREAILAGARKASGGPASRDRTLSCLSCPRGRDAALVPWRRRGVRA